jgi:hypothetical protein
VVDFTFNWHQLWLEIYDYIVTQCLDWYVSCLFKICFCCDQKNYRICSGVILCLFLEIAREIYSSMDEMSWINVTLIPTEFFYELPYAINCKTDLTFKHVFTRVILSKLVLIVLHHKMYYYFFFIKISSNKLPVLRIRDVYPGSRILIFTHPGSKNCNKRERWKKISGHTFLCSHKFHKIVNYFSFEVLKKKIWANFQRIIELFTKNWSKKLLKIWSWDPGSGKNLSRIQGSKSTQSRIPDPDPQHCKLRGNFVDTRA